MKSMVDLINKVIRNCFIKILIVNFSLISLYYYYQPLCEPCLDQHNCPPCLSTEQYFIIYSGIIFDLALGIYCLKKKDSVSE